MDWEVLLGIMGLLVGNFATSIWWAASINQRIRHIEKQLDKTSDINERMSAVEASLKGMGRGLQSVQSSVSKIETYLIQGGRK